MYRTPQALHSVLGPSGPALHTGVICRQVRVHQCRGLLSDLCTSSVEEQAGWLHSRDRQHHLRLSQPCLDLPCQRAILPFLSQPCLDLPCQRSQSDLMDLDQHCVQPKSATRDGHVSLFRNLYRVAGLTCVKHWVQAWPVVIGAAGLEVVARLRLVAAAALASEAATVGLQGRPGRRLFAAEASAPIPRNMNEITSSQPNQG